MNLPREHEHRDPEAAIEAQIIGPGETAGNRPPVVTPPQHFGEASTPNPYLACMVEPEPAPPSQLDQYHKVVDIAGGPNLRWRDNLYQAIAIVAFMLLGVPAGAAIAWFSEVHPLAGAFGGAFAGLVLGFFASGLVLMFYRMFRH